MDHVTNQVDDNNGVVAIVIRRLLGVHRVARLVEQKCGHVRREDGSVDDEEQDDPVPQSLEG